MAGQARQQQLDGGCGRVGRHVLRRRMGRFRRAQHAADRAEQLILRQFQLQHLLGQVGRLRTQCRFQGFRQAVHVARADHAGGAFQGMRLQARGSVVARVEFGADLARRGAVVVQEAAQDFQVQDAVAHDAAQSVLDIENTDHVGCRNGGVIIASGVWFQHAVQSAPKLLNCRKAGTAILHPVIFDAAPAWHG
ncbi:hypothetical protein D3C72_1476990 [compost metagenome]